MSIAVERDGRVLRIALDRASERNVLTGAMARALVDAIDEGCRSAGVGTILLSGRGEFFCYGAEPALEARELFAIRERLTKPLIAAVQGAALGTGLALAAMAPIAVAAQGTSFGLLEIRNRMAPPGLRVVADAIGWRQATALALSGRVMSTPEALAMGLVQEIAPAFEFEDRAEAIARLLADADAEAVREILLSRPSSR